MSELIERCEDLINGWKKVPHFVTPAKELQAVIQPYLVETLGDRIKRLRQELERAKLDKLEADARRVIGDKKVDEIIKGMSKQA